MPRASVLKTFVIALLCSILFASAVAAQSVAIKNNETVPINSVYWIANCKSILKSFAGIEILAGPPEVTLWLKDSMVHATRQNCSEAIKGATVMATAKGVRSPSNVTLTYRVRYKTLDGDRQSSHTVQLNLFP